MYKLCKTEESATRQRELETGLLAAMGALPYEEITVSDLCQQMQIPRKSFYRYFSSKDGALHALIDHTLMEYGSYNEPVRNAVEYPPRYGLERFFSFWASQKPLLDALRRSNLSGVLIERAINHAQDEKVIPKFFLVQRTDVAQDRVISFVMCGLMSMVLQWHHSDFQQSHKEMAAIATEMLTTPLVINI